MDAKPEKKRAMTPVAIERMRTAALARHDSESAKSHARVRAVMTSIQTEMAANDGIYPLNKGAVSMAEVARRAKIHPFTFHKPRYLELAKEVRTWLETLKLGSVVGRGRVRKELGTRVHEWKTLYEELLETHRISETDLEHAKAQLNEVLLENGKLRQMITEQASLKVVPMQLKKKD
jgi:hypothetical protein